MKLIALLLALGLSGCAITRSTASDAAVADTASTGTALAFGGIEANPLGLLTIPLKIALLAHVETLPDAEKQDAQTTMSALWNAGAVNNVCVVAVIVSGGIASLPCIFLGAGYGVWEYTTTKANQMQQEFAELCAKAKQDNPAMRCFYRGVEV